MLKICVLLLFHTLAFSKLYQVLSLFRHGARNHLNSIYDGNSTYGTWGQLTPVECKTLNKEYVQNLKFLSDKFNKKEIELYSTTLNRTIISGLSQLYGIYPPGNGPKMATVDKKYHLPPYFTNQTDINQQSFSFPEGHQHIPVKFDGQLLIQYCPKLNDLINTNVQTHSQQINQMNLTYTPFIKRMMQMFNLTFTSFDIMTSLFDTLDVDKFMGKPLPDGLTLDDFNNLKHLHNWYNNLKFSGTVSKLLNSKKFTKLINEFDNRIKNLNGYQLKWTFLSAHDTDILPAQTALNFSSSQCIQQLYRKGKTDALNCQTQVAFASSIIYELHSDNDKDFYVMIRSQGKYMNLCQQKSTKCSYTQFKARIEKYIVNVHDLCGLNNPLQDKMKYSKIMDASQYHT